MSAYPGETVTLTVAPDTGYTLTSISATSITLSGTGMTRTFTMPAHDVTVTASFRSMSAQEKWTAALALIENATFTLTQQEAPNESAARYRLAERINALIASTGFTISADDIVIFRFVPALEGSAVNRSGVNGLCEFRVTPSGVTPSAYNNGTITATSYDDVANGEWRMENGELKVWTQNGWMHVSGLTVGRPWYIYNLYGQLIYTGIADGEKVEIPLPGKGIFVIVYEKVSLKTIVQ